MPRKTRVFSYLSSSTGIDHAELPPWPRHALLYSFLFLMGAETFLISPLLPTIAANLHTSTGMASQMVTAYVLAYAVAAPLLGGVSDRFPRRVFISAGAIVFLSGNLLCAAADNLTTLTAARAVTGLGGAAAAPAMWAYFSENTPALQRGRVVSGGVACYALGQVLGVPAGSILSESANWRWTFVTIAALLLPLIPIIALRLHGAQLQPGKTQSVRFSFTVWRTPRVALPLMSTGFLQAGRLGAYTFIGVLFTHRHGLNTSQLGLLGLLVGAGTMTGSLISGRVTDSARNRGSDENTLSSVFALLFVVAAGVALLSKHTVISMTALFVWFLAGGAFYTTQQTYLGIADPQHRASIVSWNSTLDHAGVALGTALLAMWPIAGAGFIATTLGFGATAATMSYLTTCLNRQNCKPLKSVS